MAVAAFGGVATARMVTTVATSAATAYQTALRMLYLPNETVTD
jgi:hypothetical protein